MVFVSYGKDFKVAGGAPNIGARAELVGSLTVTGSSGFSGLIPLTMGVVLGLEWCLGGVRGKR